MSDPSKYLSHFYIIACRGRCCDLNENSRPPLHVHEYPSTCMSDISGSRYCTWRPLGSIFLSLCKNENGNTIVHTLLNGESYYASECVMLPASIRAGVTVLGQYVEDMEKGTGKLEPRILIFDTLDNGADTKTFCHVRDRYQFLLDHFQHLNIHDSILRLQWVGEYSGSRIISSGQMQLPHDVKSILLLDDVSPYSIEEQDI